MYSLLELILGEFGLEITEQIDAAFCCNCSQERVSRVLYSIGKEELDAMITDGEPIEVKCHFCNTAYKYSIKEIELLMETASLKNAAKKLGMNVGNESNAGARPEKPGNQHD